MNAEKNHWLDDPDNVNKIVYALYICCALLLLPDFLPYKEHLHLPFEFWWGFHGFYGLIGCVLLVLAAKGMRVVLKREEDYYDG